MLCRFRPQAWKLAAPVTAQRRMASKGKVQDLYVFTQEKGGMKGYDKALQQKVIQELSVGSAHYEHSITKDKEYEAQAKELKNMLKKTKTKQELMKEYEKAARELVKEVEANRVEGEWCCVLDMDAFYASVEILDNPSLKDIPMVVGSKSMITTANYPARRYGVRSAMPGFIAIELCKRQNAELKFIKPDMAKYKKVSKKVKQSLSTFPGCELSMRSLDEVYINMTSYVKKLAAKKKIDEHSAADLAVQQMREKIKTTTKLTASGGIGPNLLFAKLAADINKPNGQFSTPFEKKKYMKWLSSHPIRKLPGVGKVTEKLLSKGIGIETVGDLLDKKAELMCAYSTKKKTVKNLLSSALGIAPCRIETKKQITVGAEKTFARLEDPVSQSRACKKVVKMAFESLPKSTTPVYGFTLRVKMQDYSIHSRQYSSPVKMTEAQVLRRARSLFEEIDPDSVRLLGVRFILAKPATKK